MGVTASGAPFCCGLTDTVVSSISIFMNQFIVTFTSTFDTLPLNSLVIGGNLISSFGIDNPELIKETIKSFPIDMHLLTEYDPEQDITQLIHEINFLTGTIEDSTAFIGIVPDAIPSSQLQIGGFSFLYHQLQGGFRWHTDWDESLRVSTAFHIMDSLNINGFRIETFWRSVQVKTYTSNGLNPADVTSDIIDSLISDSDYWDVTEFDRIQKILDSANDLGLTPFMAIGVSHEDRIAVTDEGLRITPATTDWVTPVGYIGVSAQTYLYNLKVYAYATVKFCRT